MRVRIDSSTQPLESEIFGAELRQIFEEIDARLGSGALASECSPPIDVYETDDSIELAMDLPAVAASSLHVVIKGDAVLIAGEKAPHRAQARPSFHVVEREYGRFARTIKLAAAVDARHGRASLVRGELRLTLPKLVDRRGLAIRVPVSTNATVG